MKKSFVTWRLSFISLPDKKKIRQTAAIIAPVAKVEKPADYAFIAREYGLHDILFIEPEAELTASEIALNVLTKAHRIAKGWSIVWPSFEKKNGNSLTPEEERRAAMPESMDLLSGFVNRSFSFASFLNQDIDSASFTVKVTAEAQISEPIKPLPEKPREEPVLPPPGPEAISVMAALGRLLISYRTTLWKFDVTGAAKQLEGFGFKPGEKDYGALTFTAPDKTVARIMPEGDSVKWVEFVLASYKDPHLLDETAFAKKQEGFETLFNQAAHYAKALLGTPLFSGASGETGFPKDQWADFAAVWQAPCGRLMIEQKHNDKEMPIELCLTFAPAD